MRKRTASGRLIDRFCNKCGRWCTRTQRSRLWTHLSQTRAENVKEDPVYCTVCFPPRAAAMLIVRQATILAQVVEGKVR